MNGMLFTPNQLGSLSLTNRIVMAPLTRSRAIGNVPNAHARPGQPAGSALQQPPGSQATRRGSAEGGRVDGRSSGSLRDADAPQSVLLCEHFSYQCDSLSR